MHESDETTFGWWASKYAADPFSGNRIWLKGPQVQTVLMTSLKVSVAVGRESEIALRPPVPASPLHPPTPTLFRRPTGLASDQGDKLVGFETRYIVISFLIPVTISTALILSRAYSQLCRISCLFVLLSALKRSLHQFKTFIKLFVTLEQSRGWLKGNDALWDGAGDQMLSVMRCTVSPHFHYHLLYYSQRASSFKSESQSTNSIPQASHHTQQLYLQVLIILWLWFLWVLTSPLNLPWPKSCLPWDLNLFLPGFSFCQREEKKGGGLKRGNGIKVQRIQSMFTSLFLHSTDGVTMDSSPCFSYIKQRSRNTYLLIPLTFNKYRRKEEVKKNSGNYR